MPFGTFTQGCVLWVKFIPTTLSIIFPHHTIAHHTWYAGSYISMKGKKKTKTLNLVRCSPTEGILLQSGFCWTPRICGIWLSWPSTAHSKLCSAAFPPALQGKASQTAFHPHRHLLSIWEELGSVIHLYTTPFIAALVSPLNNSTQDVWQPITVNGVIVESHFWKIPPQAKYCR